MEKIVKQFMNNTPKCVQITDKMDHIMALMTTSRISHLPVLDDQNSFAGVVSKNDVLEKLTYIMEHNSGRTYDPKALQSSTAQELMSRECLIVKPEDSLAYAVELLLQHEFHCVPVVEEGKLVGLLTAFDLLKGYYETYG